jgi:uncharacterized protein YbbC (DUF1343 family)
MAVNLEVGHMRPAPDQIPLPVRHGMTVGELAQMFNAENHIGVELHRFLSLRSRYLIYSRGRDRHTGYLP